MLDFSAVPGLYLVSIFSQNNPQSRRSGIFSVMAAEVVEPDHRGDLSVAGYFGRTTNLHISAIDRIFKKNIQGFLRYDIVVFVQSEHILCF